MPWDGILLLGVLMRLTVGLAVSSKGAQHRFVGEGGIRNFLGEALALSTRFLVVLGFNVLEIGVHSNSLGELGIGWDVAVRVLDKLRSRRDRVALDGSGRTARSGRSTSTLVVGGAIGVSGSRLLAGATAARARATGDRVQSRVNNFGRGAGVVTVATSSRGAGGVGAGDGGGVSRRATAFSLVLRPAQALKMLTIQVVLVFWA